MRAARQRGGALLCPIPLQGMEGRPYAYAPVRLPLLSQEGLSFYHDVSPKVDKRMEDLPLLEELPYPIGDVALRNAS